MRNSLVKPTWYLAGLLSCLFLAATLHARSPSHATKVRVGPPPGPSPMARSDSSRSGLTKRPLPPRFRVVSEHRVEGGIAAGVATDAEGRMVVAALKPTLVQLSAAGELLWSREIGKSPAVVQPVLTSDGTRVVLTGDNVLFGFDTAGRQRFRLRLPGDRAASADLLPLPDGSVAVALTGLLLKVSARGSIQDSAPLRPRAHALLEQGGDILVLAAGGAVLRWRSPHSPRRVASLGGVPQGAVLTGRRLLAIIDGQRLVDLDLPTLTQHTRWVLSAGQALDTPIALPRGNTLTWTDDGLLLGHSRSGSETLRVSLEPGARQPSPVSSSPVMADQAGRFAFARSGLGLGMVQPDGTLEFVEGASCDVPVSLVEAGTNRYVLACRSGALWLLEADPGK